MLGTSGQQHLHQQHLQQQAAAASGATTSQLASPIAKSHHISVSRAHSFPKTSPLAMANDYQVRAGSQGGVTSRAPNVTAPHGRSTNSNSSSSSSSSSHTQSQNVSSGASHSTQSSKSSRGTSSNSQSVAYPSSLVQVQEKAGRRSPSHTHSHSPRTSRKATADRAVKHAAAMSGLASGRDTAAAPPVAARSSSQQSPSSKPSPSPHSMLTTTATITPPNKVVGATVDELLPLGAISQLPSQRDREHRDHERRDREKEKVFVWKFKTLCKINKFSETINMYFLNCYFRRRKRTKSASVLLSV